MEVHWSTFGVTLAVVVALLFVYHLAVKATAK